MLIIQPSKVVRAPLVHVRPPHPFVVISQSWPSVLIPILALKLPLAGVFFPRGLHKYFKPPSDKQEVKPWLPLPALATTTFASPVVFFVSGDLAFIESVWRHLGGSKRVIVSLELDFRLSLKVQRFVFTKFDAFLKTHELQRSVFRDHLCGGATDATFIFGFGYGLGSQVVPSPTPNVPRAIRHYIEGGENVPRSIVKVPITSLTPLPDEPRRAAIWEEQGSLKFLRGEGLLPVSKMDAKVGCPSHFHPGFVVLRPLSFIETLRLHQIPLHMDKELKSGGFRRPYPFESSASSVIFTSILRQLWGGVGGGLVNDTTDLHSGLANDDTQDRESESDNNVVVNTAMSHNATAGASTLETSGSTPTDIKQSSMTDSDNVPDQSLDFDADVTLTTSSSTESHSSSSVDTAVDKMWQFEFENGFSPLFAHNNEPLDDDTITTSDSVETLVVRNPLPSGVERVELCSSPPLFETGPPFSVGQVIFAIPAGGPSRDGKRAFVMEADHPKYILYLETGETVDTSAHSPKFDLFPRYRMGEGTRFAADPDDPFELIRSKCRHNHGSFGLVHDSLLDSLQRIREEKAHAKAVKSDDARVPVELWNAEIRCDRPESSRDAALDFFRSRCWRRYIRNLTRDCASFLRTTYGDDWSKLPRRNAKGKLTPLGQDQYIVNQIIWHATHTNWFEYNAGSRLVHFRWPRRYRKFAKTGVPVWFESPGPTSKEPQPPISEPTRSRVREKIEKVVHRRYMVCDDMKLKSYIRYFGVPKGDDDIRLVYDGTASGLNDSLWVPSFWLPTIDSVTRALGSDSYMADRDIGDCFLNYQLDPAVVPYTGVDLNPLYKKGENEHARIGHWDRSGMGFKSSPYTSCLLGLVVEEVCKGDRNNTRLGIDGKEENPFQWHSVRLNLPGPDYDPSLSWVSKLRKDGRLACDIFTFVDDERLVGPTRELTYQAAHTMAAKQAYMGVQDSSRKVRPVSKRTGAWAGSVVHVIEELGVCQLTSEEKWQKMKTILQKLASVLDGGAKELNHSELISDTGFLVYVTRTYPSMIPYLKGFHLTAHMWRGDRDEEGWKLPPKQSLDDDDNSVTSLDSLTSLDITRAGSHGLNLDREASFGKGTRDDQEESALNYVLKASKNLPAPHAPASNLTPVVPRLRDDVWALQQLTQSELPALKVVRPTMVVQVFYGFGDAAGKGFGATIAGNFNCSKKLSQPHTRQGLNYRLGVWNAQEEMESSNWKEFSNLVDATEEEAAAGRLQNCEFFLFTDNSTAESCFYRGSSKSDKLHRLVVRLRRLEMDHGLLIHLIHVSGKRMIAQGTDGCSRGFLMEGVMAGENMLDFVDLGKSAIDRHPLLLKWLQSWTTPDLKPLKPEGWFVEGHGITGGKPDSHKVWIPTHEPSGCTHCWAPPPAAADAALEELAKARHKRTDTYHVIVIPRLMAPRWRRLFNKTCDFSFVVSPGVSFWPDNMFEPLWVGIVLPFTQHRPWCFKRAPILVEMGRDLRRMLHESEEESRNLLRKLWSLPKRVAPVSQRVACGMLHVPWKGQVSPKDRVRRSRKSVAQRGGSSEKN